MSTAGAEGAWPLLVVVCREEWLEELQSERNKAIFVTPGAKLKSPLMNRRSGQWGQKKQRMRSLHPEEQEIISS